MAGDLRSFRDACDRLARAPHDSQLLYDCCATAGEVGEKALVALIEGRLRTIPLGEKIRLHDLHLLVMFREKHGRAAAGLGAANTDDRADLEFKFAREELRMLVRESLDVLERDRRHFPAALLLADASVALGAFVDAEYAYSRLRAGTGDHISTVTTFDPEFHAALPDTAYRTAMKLAPVMMVRELPPDAARIVFTAADFVYFQVFGWNFIETFVKNNVSNVCLTLHIFDMTPQEKTETVQRLASYQNLAWSLSTEWTGLRGGESSVARGYYHAVRFTRFWQCLNAAQVSAWMIDMDTLFNADVKGLFDPLSGQDLVLFLSPARFEPRNKVMASCLGVADTQAARDYLRNVSGYIGRYHQKGRLLWGIDQVALYAVLVMQDLAIPLRVTGVPDWIADGSRRPGQILWPAKGD